MKLHEQPKKKKIFTSVLTPILQKVKSRAGFAKSIGFLGNVFRRQKGDSFHVSGAMNISETVSLQRRPTMSSEFTEFEAFSAFDCNFHPSESGVRRACNFTAC